MAQVEKERKKKEGGGKSAKCSGLLESVGLEELVGLCTSETSEEIFHHLMIFRLAIAFFVLLVSAIHPC